MRTCNRRVALTLLTAGSVPAWLPSESSAQQTDGNTPRDLPQELSSLRKEFDALKKQWMVERKEFRFHSQIERYWDGPIGKQILDMGPRILPLIVKELRGGDFFFNYPMRVFAGFLLGGHDLDSEQHRSKLWIQWYDELSR